MPEHLRPYIGVTGFTTRTQIEHALDATLYDESKRVLMAGVLANDATLRGEPSPHFPKRYPTREVLSEIFFPHHAVLNIVHYHTARPHALASDLERVMHLAGPWCDGVQINNAWPDPTQLQEFRQNMGRKVTIILPINKRMFESVNGDFDELCQQLLELYSGLVDYLLFDMSGGQGQRISVELATQFVTYCIDYAMASCFMLGVAGGLNCWAYETLEDIVHLYPHLCIDAEGAMRDSEDNLNERAVQAYVSYSNTLLPKFN